MDRSLCRLITRICCLSLALSFGSSLSASTQGTTGATSTGSLEINLVLNQVSRITGLTDLDLGVWSGSGDAEADDSFCVGRNVPTLFGGTSPYQVRISGDGAGGNPSAFVLSNGVANLPYEVFYNDGFTTTGRQPVQAGVTLGGQVSPNFALAFNAAFGCSFFNANISVIIRESALRQVAGNFNGTLTVVIIPE